MEKNEISRALEELANEIERAPIELVGVKVSVESGQGGQCNWFGNCRLGRPGGKRLDRHESLGHVERGLQATRICAG